VHIERFHEKKRGFVCQREGCDATYTTKKRLQAHDNRMHADLVLQGIIPINLMPGKRKRAGTDSELDMLAPKKTPIATPLETDSEDTQSEAE